MASFNKVILAGNLTRDPELRMTANNLAICKLGLAVSRVFTTKDGERREDTTFVDIDAFGRQAETLAKYMTKGRPLLVEGRLQLDSWETQSGEKRNKLKVVCENFQFLGGGRSEESGGAGGGNDYEDAAPPPRARAKGGDDGDLDEDVPF
jgi:single-strand DNA-binding protein